MNRFINKILKEYYSDNTDPYEDLDYADKWLAKYTYEGLNKYPNKDIVNILLKRS